MATEEESRYELASRLLPSFLCCIRILSQTSSDEGVCLPKRWESGISMYSLIAGVKIRMFERNV